MPKKKYQKKKSGDILPVNHFGRLPEFGGLLQRSRLYDNDNDNDNDNDTLREVPHQSNEGLALQARVSGPWPLKKESVLLGKLAHWQGVQVQTVMDRV